MLIGVGWEVVWDADGTARLDTISSLNFRFWRGMSV